jgi:hypothetical protein
MTFNNPEPPTGAKGGVKVKSEVKTTDVCKHKGIEDFDNSNIATIIQVEAM